MNLPKFDQNLTFAGTGIIWDTKSFKLVDESVNTCDAGQGPALGVKLSALVC